VPRSAELKLIQKLQKRVLKRTQNYDTSVPEQLRVTEEAKDEAFEISRKQGKVEKLTRKLANKINKEQQANNN
jgi:hypothetical protein